MTEAIKTERSQNRRQNGFSLVEIMVTLVILLIGVLAILRLFPGGFLTIQRTGEQVGALALSKRQIEDQKNSLTSLESIVGVLPNNLGEPTPVGLSRLQPRPDQNEDYTPDELSTLAGVPLAAAQESDKYSNINRLRGIVGETFRIPTLTPNRISGGAGAIYLLQFGPVYNKFVGTQDRITVKGASLERTIQSSQADLNRPDPTPTLRNDNEYAIDYDNNRIAFAARSDQGRSRPYRDFQVSVTYYYEAGNIVRIRTANLKPITVLDSNLPSAWVPIDYRPTLNAGENFLGYRRESEEVSRKFTLIQASPVATTGPVNGWSDDPYEYGWFSPQYGTDANAGVLVFNPIGRNATIQTSTGPSPFLARVDYITYDNHIIRDDRQLPTEAPYDLKLSLPQIVTNGDRLEDQSVYDGLFANGTPSFLIYNTSTGEELKALANRCIGGSDVPYTIDPKSGTLRVNQVLIDKATALGENLKGANLRIFYRTQKEHGMQVQKAHSHYTEGADTATADTLTYKDFLVGGGASGATRIYFPRSEGGKSVVLGDYYVATNKTQADFNKDSNNLILVTDNGNNNVYCRHFASETYQISTATDPIVNLCYIDVSVQHSEATTEGWSLTRLVTGAAVQNVQGASLKSRILWRDSTKQIKDGITGVVRSIPRWRKLDSDTILIPKTIQ